MTDQEAGLVPVTTGDERRNALLRAVGFDQLSEPQRELALAIAQRYELDPMLKHLVMVEGRPYITRDGLLHVAHKSNDFDGIEVTDPVLDDKPAPNGKKYWRSRATVYRKSFKRPFVYPGRYPSDGGNAKYAEEMCIKVAEVMCLRRAFDVSAPTVEERWDEIADTEVSPDGGVAEPPKTLAERAARRVAAIEGGDEPGEQGSDAEGSTKTAENDEVVDGVVVEPAAPETAVEGVVERGAVPGSFVAGPEPTSPDDEPASELTINAFSEWAQAHDVETIKQTARSLYPEMHQFSDLTVGQLGRLQLEVERVERLADAADAETLTDDERAAIAETAPEPEGSTKTAAEPAADAEPVSPEKAPETAAEPVGPTSAPVPFDKPTLCGQASPLSGNTCTMDAGHKGVHRAGLKEAW